MLRQCIVICQKCANEIVCIGYSINDLYCIEYFEHTACPADAVEEIKKEVVLICKTDGGRGSVSELISFLGERLIVDK